MNCSAFFIQCSQENYIKKTFEKRVYEGYKSSMKNGFDGKQNRGIILTESSSKTKVTLRKQKRRQVEKRKKKS